MRIFALVTRNRPLLVGCLLLVSATARGDTGTGKGARVHNGDTGAIARLPPPQTELTTPAFHGNVRSKVFHGSRCKHYRCTDCTAVFKTMSDATKAGYRPHMPCVHGDRCYRACLDGSRELAITWDAIQARCRRRCAGSSLIDPPRRPWSKNRICKQNSDCTLLRAHPRCPCACGKHWMTALNKSAGRARQCPSHNRCRCLVMWFGTSAVCVKGQCTVTADTLHGYLIANTTPTAEVLVDGEDTGRKTPIAPESKMALAPGHHMVTFVVGSQRFRHPITITAGRTARLVKNLSVGSEPPQSPEREDRACGRNSDCRFLPAVCQECYPCKPTWRRVGNLVAAREISKLQNVVRCAAPACRPCASRKNWLGTETLCVKGQCEVRP